MTYQERDILGMALFDFHTGKKKRPQLWIHNHYGDPDLMDPGVYFRDPNQMPKIELFALSLCEGRILDVGAGVGAHALPLQSAGLEVTALEISETACTIMGKRGVRDVQNADFFHFRDGCYDILFFMMNGIGFAGDINGLKKTLMKAKDVLNPNGMLLFDSSDVSYLYPKSRLESPPYFGELDYQYQYGNRFGPWFKWLYIDQKKMAQIAMETGWHLQILYEDDTGHYLGGLQYF